MPFLSIHWWLLFSTLPHMGRPDFQSLSVQVAAWMPGREVLQLAAIRGGTGLWHPLEGTSPKPGSVPVHSNSSARWSRWISCPRRKVLGGAVPAVVSSACGHWAPRNYIKIWTDTTVSDPPKGRKEPEIKDKIHSLLFSSLYSVRSEAMAAGNGVRELPWNTARASALLWPTPLLPGALHPQQGQETA